MSGLSAAHIGAAARFIEAYLAQHVFSLAAGFSPTPDLIRSNAFRRPTAYELEMINSLPKHTEATGKGHSAITTREPVSGEGGRVQPHI